MTYKTLLIVALTGSIIGGPRTGQAQGPSSPSPMPHVHGAELAAMPFASDGCSGFRDARFFTCCYVHDLTYWAGGTRDDRRQADLALRRCVLDISNGYIANFAYFLVRLGTVPTLMFNDPWGRAWRGSERKRFAALTPEQRARVDQERRRACEALRLNPTTGGYRVDDTREIRPQQAQQVCGGDPPARAR